jgi:penicillin-binding protein 2
MKVELTIKNARRETQLFQGRLLAASILIGLLAILLFARLIYLQILQHRHFTTLSTQNSIQLLPIVPTRGLIYDRNGVVLADNIPVFSLMITPDKAGDLNQTINDISKIITLTPGELESFHKQLKQHRQFEEIPLKLKLSDKEVATLSINQFKFPGVSVEAQLIRVYPFNKSFAHVVGFEGRINTKELKYVDASNYAATNFIGKVGVEKYYESELHGQVGYKKEEVDAAGRDVRTVGTVPSVHGESIYLTIDSQLQLAVEKALGGLRGSVVAIQPSTGQVLALVSAPEYDPNAFVTGISHKDYNELSHDPRHPLYNRAIRGLYPPGSTIKPFVGLAALNSKTVTPDYKILDPGFFQLPDSTHIYHDWKKGGHGWTNITKAIIESCDTYFYTISHQMGIEPMADMLDSFGFGQITGIEMGEELAGTVSSPAWKEQHIGKSWYPGATVLTAIGQGYMQTTPLQLASATATLSERGQRFQPTLRLATQSTGGDVVPNTPNEKTSIGINNPGDWNVIINAMQKVITEGTGKSFGRTAYSVAAKTGTAQVISQDIDEQAYLELPENLRNNSVFVAFAPVENPQIAIAVVVEHSHEAPAIARQVMDAYMNKTL